MISRLCKYKDQEYELYNGEIGTFGSVDFKKNVDWFGKDWLQFKIELCCNGEDLNDGEIRFVLILDNKSVPKPLFHFEELSTMHMVNVFFSKKNNLPK